VNQFNLVQIRAKRSTVSCSLPYAPTIGPSGSEIDAISLVRDRKPSKQSIEGSLVRRFASHRPSVDGIYKDILYPTPNSLSLGEYALHPCLASRLPNGNTKDINRSDLRPDTGSATTISGVHGRSNIQWPHKTNAGVIGHMVALWLDHLPGYAAVLFFTSTLKQDAATYARSGTRRELVRPLVVTVFPSTEFPRPQPRG